MTFECCDTGGGCLHWASVRTREEYIMKNPLESLWGTVITGLVLTAILYYVAKLLIGA
jgi:hypothetical protein